MAHLDAITLMERRAGRRFDDGTFDVAAGLLLFGLGASLDLGEPQPMVLLYVPIIVLGLRTLLVWPRVGYARTRARALTQEALALGVCFVVALTVALLLGVERATGVAPASAAADRVRLVSAAAIWALAGLLAWRGWRRGIARHWAYAVAVGLAFAVGPLAGVEARAWVLAFLGLAWVAIGALRLRALVAAHPPLAEEDAGGA